MKPYKKIIRTDEIISFYGHYRFKLSVREKKQQPQIPLSFFSNISIAKQERLNWLKLIKK